MTFGCSLAEPLFPGAGCVTLEEMYDGLIDLKSALRTKLEKVLLSKYVDLSDDGSPASLKAKQATAAADAREEEEEDELVAGAEELLSRDSMKAPSAAGGPMQLGGVGLAGMLDAGMDSSLEQGQADGDGEEEEEQEEIAMNENMMAFLMADGDQSEL